MWGIIHSVMASLRWKRMIRDLLGNEAMRAYRLAYNAFAFMSFLPILALLRALPDRQLYAVPAPWRYLMFAAQAAAAMLLLLGLLQTDSLHFVGLRQLVRAEGESRLVRTGLYGWVRHPLYLFGLVLLWLTPTVSRNLLTVYVLLTVYIFIGATLEENRLLDEFGATYSDYRSRTPMIIPTPRIWRRTLPKAVATAKR
jgi:protein-S-isoprenylcysteine O-methyltransferase Ste14